MTTYVILEHGADPNISSSRGKTPSDVASRLKILRLLSGYRAKPIGLYCHLGGLTIELKVEASLLQY